MKCAYVLNLAATLLSDHGYGVIGHILRTDIRYLRQTENY